MNLRIRPSLLAVLWLCAWMLPLPPAHAEVAIPALKTYVTDLTRTLTPNQQDSLEQLLKNLDTRKGSQIAVLMVPTTEPETIEQYAIRVADAWKLGRKGIDDGVLLLVAVDDRAVRIEVGRGLEGVLPDAVANRITDEIIVPFFKQGDLYGGLQAGSVRMIRIIEGEPLPPVSAKQPGWSGVRDFLPMLFIGIVAVGGLLRALFGRLIGAGLVAGTAGIIFWAILGSLLGALLVGVIIFVVVLAGGGRRGIGPGGWGGGLGGGGFGGGGGLSGGGGSFGGGGATGRW
jgi:uncharacterized protein